MAAPSFAVGQAPWETQNSAPPGAFPVGQAPWETPAAPVATATQPQPSLGGQILKGIGNVVSGIVQPFASIAATPGQALVAGVNKVAGTHFADPYAQGMPGILGSHVDISPLNLKQKAGDALKIGADIGAVAAAPASIPAAIGTGAAIGGAQAAGGALQQNASTLDVAKQGARGALLGGVVGGAAAGIGQLLGKFGEQAQKYLIKPSTADTADGFSMNTIKQYNLGGTLYQIQDKTQKTINDLSGQLRQKLGASNSSINLTNVLDQTIADISSGGSKLKTFGANTRMESALQQLQNEVNAVTEHGALSIPDAQIIKQAAGQFGSWQFGKVDPEAKASEMVYNTFYNKLKTAIEDESPSGVKEINQQLSKLIPVSNAIVRRLPVYERRSPLSLTDFIGLTASTFEPHALGLTLLNFLSKNGAVSNALMQHAHTTGSVLAPYASFAAGSAIPHESSTTSSPPQ